MRPRSVRLPVALGTLLLATACGDDTTEPTNRPPTASIAADPTEVLQGDDHTTVVTLDGSGSTDPDGDALTFGWTVPSGRFVNGTSATSATASVTFPGAAPYTVTLDVSDGQGGTDQEQVTIGITTNRPPVAAVTADPTSVPAGDGHTTVVTIDATGSTDPDGDPLTYSWVVPSGMFVQGTTDSDATIRVTFPGAAPYAVTVTVSDGRGGTDEASVTINLS